MLLLTANLRLCKPYLIVSKIRQKSFSKFLESQISKTETISKENLKPIKYQELPRICNTKRSETDLLFVQSKRKRKELGTFPKKAYFQVTGHGGPGVGNSLILFTDHNRYLFNCGENTQRSCVEHCHFNTFLHMENVFITSRTWKNLGGLLGMCLTLRQTGSSVLNLHGPKGCMDIYEATKSFVTFENFDVKDFTKDDDVYEDHAIRVTHVNLESSLEPKVAPEPLYSTWEPDTYVLRRTHNLSNPRKDAQRWSRTPINTSVKAYVVTIKSEPKKFSWDKCLSLGVPPGDLLNELKSGREIILDDGSLVKPSDVFVVPQDGEKVFIVIECPDKSYLPSLLSASRLSTNDLKYVAGIFHFTSDDVIDCDEYVGWANSFGDSTQHIIFNESSVGFATKDMLLHNAKLNRISDEIFRDLVQIERNNLLTVSKRDYPKLTGVARQAETANRIFVNPKVTELRAVRAEEVDDDEIEHEIDSLDGARESIAFVKESVGRVWNEQNSAKEFPKFPIVTFLGTGSTVPSKYRNSSAILVETQKDNFVLMDCGEGTLLQLYRIFGTSRGRHILSNLKAVYVSHLHADHHMGLINVVLERSKVFKIAGRDVEKLFIIGPRLISQYLTFYHHNFEPILTDLYPIQNEHLLYFHPEHRKFLKLDSVMLDVFREMLSGINLKSIRTCPAVHCPDSHSVSIITKDGFKIVYTGDTRPNKGLYELGVAKGQPPDLLIHEATMEHHMIESAVSKKHSTFTEAIQEGIAMNAKFTILTHFSQRYSKIPVLDEIDIDEVQNVGIAFDGMSVSPATFRHTRLILPALKKIFPVEVEEMGERKKKKMEPKYQKNILHNLLN